MDAKIETLLAEYRFDEAVAHVSRTGDPDPESVLKHIEKARLACEPAARRRNNAIQAAARNHDFPELIRLAQDPLTIRMLSVLPAELQTAAQLQLDNASDWLSQRVIANARRLVEAEDALESFDLRLSRSIIHRLEERYLTDDDRANRDRLLLAIEARSMEAESLADIAKTVEAELRPPRRRRWWSRRSD